MPLPLRSCVIKGRSTKSRSNNGQSKEDSSSRVDQSGCEAIEDNGESQSGRCQNIQVAEANAGRNAGNGFEAGCIPIDAGLMSHRTGPARISSVGVSSIEMGGRSGFRRRHRWRRRRPPPELAGSRFLFCSGDMAGRQTCSPGEPKAALAAARNSRVRAPERPPSRYGVAIAGAAT